MTNIESAKSMFLGLLKNKDIHTYTHSKNVGQLAFSFAQHLALSPLETETARDAGELHDIGKLFAPQSILNKQGKLTSKEIDIIRNHPTWGYQAFHQYLQNKNDSIVQQIGETILNHHEHYNRAGHPNGIPLQNSSIIPSIVALCDVYDALVSERPYKPAMSVEEALQIMGKRRGTQFYPKLLDHFIQFVSNHYSFLLSMN